MMNILIVGLLLTLYRVRVKSNLLANKDNGDKIEFKKN